MKRQGLMALVGWLIMADGFAAQPVGRLFYTPQQRLQIDRQHKSLAAPRVHDVVKNTHYNGYVMRSDGVNTMWVDGKTRFVDHAVQHSGQLELPAMPALKPGQAFDSRTGRILEPYEMAQPIEPPVMAAAPLLSLPPLAGDQDDAVVQGDHVAAH